MTEASWLETPPAEHVRAWWQREYAGMQSRTENERAVERAGYTLLESFVLPMSDWWDEYYDPIEERIAALREERTDAESIAALDAHAEEIQVVRDCNDSFGYVFYVMQKPA